MKLYKGKTIGTYFLYCPGCEALHAIYTSIPNSNQAMWTFNGNMDNPTFSPSLLVTWKQGENYEIDKRCHSFIQNGNIEFLSDCTHTLASKTVPLPDIPSDKFDMSHY